MERDIDIDRYIDIVGLQDFRWWQKTQEKQGKNENSLAAGWG